MHHRKSRTTNREVKRYGHKSARAMTRQALTNNDAPKSVARDGSWGTSLPQPPLLDVPCPSGGKRKKSPPKKESMRCLPGMHHEWYREEIESESYYYVCGTHGRYCWYRRSDDQCGNFRKKTYKTLLVKKTCINCWKVIKLEEKSNLYDRYNDDWTPKPYSWRTQKRRRKIRTQDLSSGMTVSVR